MKALLAWLKSGVGLAVAVIVAVLLVFGVIRLYGMWGEWLAAKDAKWKTQVAAYQDSARIWRDSAQRDSIEYVTVTKPVYLKARETALAAPTVSAETRAVIKACDDSMNSCEREKAALRGQIGALQSQIDLLSHPPKPRRLQAFGEAAYDITGQRPVFNLGATFRLFGALSAVGRVEYAVPPASVGMSLGGGGEGRVLVGGRVNF